MNFSYLDYKKATCNLLLLFAAVIAVYSLGNLNAASADDSMPSPVAGYGIAPNDEINVDLVNFPTLTTKAVVPSDGQINLPLVGAIIVTGKTTDELSKELTRAYSVYLVKPIISVEITLKHHEIVTVGGSVVSPGAVEYTPGMRVVDAIIQAGGPSDKSDLSRVSVVHEDGDKETTDVTDPSVTAGSPADLVLSEGDAVYVPVNTREISIVGQVKTPGSYPYHDGMTVLDAIGDGGGVTDVADLSHSELISGTNTTTLDLQGLLRNGDATSNLVLHPGDTITVPLGARNYVFGDVNRPGYYPYVPGDRVLDALNGAGGTTQDADTGKVYIIHLSSDGQSAASEPVDLNKFFKHGDMTADVPLKPGDVIFVGDKHKPFNWSAVSSVLYAGTLFK